MQQVINNTFTAIDFETANGKRSSICQVGLVRFVNGNVTEKVNFLVQPPHNIYWDKMVDIHGITPSQTAKAPTFDKLWLQIEPFIAQQQVVAHCGFTFDFNCLKQTLEYYELPLPNFVGYCTYKIYKNKLDALCSQYNIGLNHHDALSDAIACGELFNLYLKKKQLQ
jgi:DNA polymerase-3 subunit epsilon